MQFNMQIKHFFCIYPCILVVFYLRRISAPPPGISGSPG